MQWLSNRNCGKLYACQWRVGVCMCVREREIERVKGGCKELKRKTKGSKKMTLSEIVKINEERLGANVQTRNNTAENE